MDDKERIEKLLRGRVTDNFGYRLKDDCKDITLTVKKGFLEKNMQIDGADFESMALVLKCYLPQVETVTIDWEDVNETEIKQKKTYNRFIYRLTRFVETYSWVKVMKEIPQIPSHLVCNYPGGKADETGHVKENGMTESQLERNFITEHKAEYDVLNQQLPVGLFDTSVKKENAFTTGGKSDIDIWGIKDDKLSIFELKLPNNKKLGIISELMFYTNVVVDLLSHVIQYDDSAYRFAEEDKNNYRNFGEFYEAYEKRTIKKIDAVMLTDSIHPFITAELLNTINDSPRWRSHGVKFSRRSVTRGL